MNNKFSYKSVWFDDKINKKTINRRMIIKNMKIPQHVVIKHKTALNPIR